MAKIYFGCDGRSFRFKRGANKFGQSWDSRKMEEREMRRRLAREEKDARKKFEGGTL